MEAASTQIINDFQWLNGLDSVNYTLPAGSYGWAQNVVNRGGMIQTRQGFAELAAIADQDPRGLGTMVISGVTWMLCAIGENIYSLNLNVAGSVLHRMNYPNGNPVRFPVGNRRMVHFEVCVQAQEALPNPPGYDTHQLPVPKFVMIIQDGVTAPHYWDGSVINTVDSLYPDTVPHNTPKAQYMKWAGDRLWTISGRKVRASNLLNPFQNTEELSTSSGGFFFLPDNVTGVGVTHDYKSLLAYTHFTTSAFQVGIEDRTIWGQTQDFQRVIFPAIGCASHRTIINMYGMTWWMSHDGWVGLDNTLSAYQSSRLDVQDHNMSRSKEGINWTTGGGCAGSYGNFLFVSVPSSNRWNNHTWVMDQAPINTLAGQSPPAWASNWTGIRPEQWVTCQIGGKQRCFCISRDLTEAGHQSTVWEAFVGQRMDIPKVNGERQAKDIGCAFETRFIGLSPSQYMRLRWIEIDIAEIIGNVDLAVYYCGRRTSYKRITGPLRLTATVSPSSEEILDPDNPMPVYVPQYRTVRSATDVHEESDNDPEVQTPYLRNKDREFSVLVEWVGQMSVTAVRLAVDPEPDYMEGGVYESEFRTRRITAEGTGSIGNTAPPANAPTGKVISQYLSPLRPRWVEFPAYDSAVPNGVFFVSELTANPPPGAYPSDQYPISVALTTETQGASIYYTQDGTNPHGPPNQHGTLYPPQPSMALNQTLKARGERQYLRPSVLLSGQYTQSQVAEPTFSPVAGDFTPDEFPVVVTLSCATPTSVIRYVINNSPANAVTPNSPVYVSPVHVPANKYLHAKAFKVFYLPSVERVGRYHQIPKCATPVAAPPGGEYPASDYEPYGKLIVGTSPTAGSVMRYTVNNPDVEHGGVVTSPHSFHVQPDDVLYLIAQKTGYANSDVLVSTYTAEVEQVATPTIDPDSVVLTGNHHERDVELDCSTPGVSMRYVIVRPGDNTQPSRTVGTLISDNHATINIGPPNNYIGHRILRVIAYRQDMIDSDIAEGTYDHEGIN